MILVLARMFNNKPLIALLLVTLFIFVITTSAAEETPEGVASASAQLAAATTDAAAGNLDQALNEYRAFVKAHPFSKSAAEAQWQVAQLLQKKGDSNGSFKAYNTLLTKYPETSHFEEAVAAEVTIANAFLKGEKIKIFGIPAYSSMERAQEMYETILKTSPYSKYAPLTQFNLGLSLERQGKGSEAIAAYQKLIDKYPNSSIGNTALYQVGYVYMKTGMAGKSQDLSALKEAQNNFDDFLVQYPNDEKSFQAHDNMKAMTTRESRDTLRIAHFYDFSKDYQASAIYYNEVIRKYSQTADATEAKARLAELKETVGEDALRSGQVKPQTGEQLAFRRKLQAQVETTALSNYDGPSKNMIKGNELPATPPEMRTNVKEVQSLSTLEPVTPPLNK